MPPSSKDVVRWLSQIGWNQVDQRGSHAQFKHPVKSGKVTVPMGNKDLSIKTLRSIERQAGSSMKDRAK
jgi:predicted RNA binding protein YcfA (HicA-like mRNA interferase family)